MKGKYITTNIILACLASATAANKAATLPKNERMDEANDADIKAEPLRLLSQAAA